jgi:hypothetical protein
MTEPNRQDPIFPGPFAMNPSETGEGESWVIQLLKMNGEGRAYAFLASLVFSLSRMQMQYA